LRGWRAALLVAALAPAHALAQGESDNVVDERIRASAHAAESYQGPLDGSWTLVTAMGDRLYAFELVDKPGGQSPLEGVWRDLRRPAGPGDIAKPGEAPVTIELKSDDGGFWSGEMKAGGADTAVRMRRG
jgi:hypothetical protein